MTYHPIFYSTSAFTIINFGATPNPCPIVPLACVPVQLTILNPLVVLADTVDVILPSVFDTPAPFAFHDHPT
jgi:hypothetical protein